MQLKELKTSTQFNHYNQINNWLLIKTGQLADK